MYLIDCNSEPFPSRNPNVGMTKESKIPTVSHGSEMETTGMILCHGGGAGGGSPAAEEKISAHRSERVDPQMKTARKR